MYCLGSFLGQYNDSAIPFLDCYRLAFQKWIEHGMIQIFPTSSAYVKASVFPRGIIISLVD